MHFINTDCHLTTGVLRMSTGYVIEYNDRARKEIPHHKTAATVL